MQILTDRVIRWLNVLVREVVQTIAWFHSLKVRLIGYGLNARLLLTTLGGVGCWLACQLLPFWLARYAPAEFIWSYFPLVSLLLLKIFW